MLVLLDVAIGLIFLYLLLSLLCSAAMEVIESILRFRSRDLGKAIERMLGSAALRDKLLDNPIIRSLKVGKRPPSYMPAPEFVLALLDSVQRGELAPPAAAAAAPAAAPPPLTIEALRTTLEANPNAPLNRTLLALLNSAQGDLTRFRTGVETWFNASMSRASGAFKRRTQWWLVGIGFALAAAVNADTIEVARALSTNGALREGVARAANAYIEQGLNTYAEDKERAAESVDAVKAAEAAKEKFEKHLADTKKLGALGLPLGWQEPPLVELRKADGVTRFTMFMGWLLTAVAISFGAPFWFDLLQKAASIRSTVKPRDSKEDKEAKT